MTVIIVIGVVIGSVRLHLFCARQAHATKRSSGQIAYNGSKGGGGGGKGTWGLGGYVLNGDHVVKAKGEGGKGFGGIA